MKKETIDKSLERERPERDDVGRLLRLAGPRPPVAEEVTERIRGRVVQHWRRATRRRRIRRWGTGAALAAASVAALLFVVPGDDPVSIEPIPAPVARVERVLGVVEVGNGDFVAPGDLVTAGQVLATGRQGRTALRFRDGRSVRLDLGTRVTVVDTTTVELHRGAVYVDSRDPMRAGLRVATDVGVVHEVGTQFEVRTIGADVRIRVREGSVRLEGGRGHVEAAAGVELSVGREGKVRRASVDPHGPEWQWVLDVAPSFDLEGRSLGELLDWVTRETGRSIRFSSPELGTTAPEIVLHGDVSGMAPDEALVAALPTCGLEARIDGREMIIEAAPR